jgi:pimeloyl-ACP methyl ester carboxylesterase
MKMLTRVLMPVLFLSLVPQARADLKKNLVRSYLKSRSLLQFESSGAAPVVSTFDQMVDHFPKPGLKSRNLTFKQRYFIDSSFAENENSPVLLYICGESTCEGPSEVPFLNRLAKKYRAHRVALEHRFYGDSQPFETLTPEHLRYLSMEQAIEDLAVFQRYAQSALKLKGKWIAIGGSYPGELSAFYRMKHPELVVGALASSAPVFAKADFFEYDRHVARVADPSCLRAIQTVVNEVEGRLASEPSRTEVKQLFQAERVTHDVDFLYVLADMAAIAIQYGFQKQFCETLLEGERTGNAVKAYAKGGLSLMGLLGTSPFQDSFGGAMSVNPEDYRAYAGRQWMYQSCTEFGFYQVANADRIQTSRSARIDLKYHHDACDRLFGIKKPVNTDHTNHEYYSRLFDSKVKNIYFTNGSNDPWSNLSLTNESLVQGLNPGLSLFLIPGAAHCDDLGSRVMAGLTEARTRFEEFFVRWLSE